MSNSVIGKTHRYGVSARPWQIGKFDLRQEHRAVVSNRRGYHGEVFKVSSVHGWQGGYRERVHSAKCRETQCGFSLQWYSPLLLRIFGYVSLVSASTETPSAMFLALL